MRSSHPLFRRFPLDGSASIATGPVCTPYHVYDGYSLFIGGTADLSSVRRLLAPESVVPLADEAGRALMGVWVCNFTRASLGPHHELQFSMFVRGAGGSDAPVSSHPLHLLKLMATPSATRMLCHGLWNDHSTVVAYNRELLGLNARHTDSRIARDDKALTFSFTDRLTGRPVLEGCVDAPRRLSLRTTLSLAAHIGWRKFWSLARQPWVGVEIHNPVGPVLRRNAVAHSYAGQDYVTVRRFDGASSMLSFGDTHYGALGFVPSFLQFMDGFRMVYMNPV